MVSGLLHQTETFAMTRRKLEPPERSPCRVCPASWGTMARSVGALDWTLENDRCWKLDPRIWNYLEYKIQHGITLWWLLEPLVGHRYLGAPEGSCEFLREDRCLIEHPWRHLDLWKVRIRPDENSPCDSKHRHSGADHAACRSRPEHHSRALIASVGDSFLLT